MNKDVHIPYDEHLSDVAKVDKSNSDIMVDDEVNTILPFLSNP